MLPSLSSAIYFIIFLILGTMWACHKAFRLRRKKAFAYLRFTLMVYSGVHVVTLYMYQFQFFQTSLPPESLLARYSTVHVNDGRKFLTQNELLIWSV